MAGRQHKKSNHPVTSNDTDDQIISDLIENRKRQMLALFKIMSSFDEPVKIDPVPPITKATPADSKKILKRKPKH